MMSKGGEVGGREKGQPVYGGLVVVGNFFGTVVESGPDVATNLKLLPLRGREHAEQSVSPSTSSGDLVPGETTMDTIYSNVAGLDVHQKTILACVRGVN